MSVKTSIEGVGGNIKEVKVLKEKENSHVIEKNIQKIEGNKEVHQEAMALLILPHILIHHTHQKVTKNKINKRKIKNKLKINSKIGKITIFHFNIIINIVRKIIKFDPILNLIN